MRIYLRYFLLLTTLLVGISVLYMIGNGHNLWECKHNIHQTKSGGNFHVSLPVIYVVTPTYGRPTQKADLTRMSHTLMHVPNLHWIVVEDSNATTKMVQTLLSKSGIPHTYLSRETPATFKLKSTHPRWLKPRGVAQRNAGIEWLRQLKLADDAVRRVVYFADDDNTYDLELFEEMRYTYRVSVWPVGLVGGLRWEGPRVTDGKVTGWIAAWKPERPFALDMAGFAINLDLLLNNPEAIFDFEVPRGYLETSLLRHVITLEDLEPKAESCTKILVWHTRTEKPKLYPNEKLKELRFPLPMDDLEV